MANYSRINSQGEIAPDGFHYMPDGTLMSDDEHRLLYGELQLVKLITDFNLDQSDMPATVSTREFSIIGEDGASFKMHIYDSSGKFYNFKSQTFTTGFISENSLNSSIDGGSYNGNIVFPANTNGDTYTILLFANTAKDTQISEVLSSNNTALYRVIIEKVADSRLTFEATTASTSNIDLTLSGIADVISNGSPLQTSVSNVAIDWSVINTASDAGGFGIALSRQPVDTDWFFSTTDTVNGAISSATEVIIDDLTNICEGMVITAVSSGGLSGTPVIIAINTDDKKLTLSSSQTFADGITLTFQARGSTVIQRATGAFIDFSTITAKEVELTKTVRADTSSTTVTLNGTYGISKGADVTGVGVVNTGDNPVVSVSASSSAGSMVMTISQTLPQGTKLYFSGCTNEITLLGTPIIKGYPSSSPTISLNLDNFITIGEGS